MRALALIIFALCMFSCEDAPELPPAQISMEPQPAAVMEKPPAPACGAACKAACAQVETDLQDGCPAAFAAGCFDGTAPEDFPCKAYLPPQEKPTPSTQNGAGADGVPALKLEPRAKERRPSKSKSKSDRIEALDGMKTEDEGKAKPTPIGD